MRRLIALTILLLSVLWHAPAQASGDFECSPYWMTAHREMTGCDDTAMLQPGNDTRTNLILLLMDLHGGKGLPAVDAKAATPDPMFDWESFSNYLVPPPVTTTDDSAVDSFAEGEGSRCLSNATGAAAFADAVNSAMLPDAEKSALIAARENLAPSCTGISGGAAGVEAVAQTVQSPLGKSFTAYLQGTQAFYEGDYDTAAARFHGLTAVDQPWLAETARYMLARVEVNRAQITAFDEYGSLKRENAVDLKVIDAAEAALLDYLKSDPNGRYAASARGLLRRVYWLGGRKDKLAAAFGALFAQDPASRGGLTDVALAEEIDNKLLAGFKSADTTDPILLAVLDLQQMRGADSEESGGCCGEPIAREALEAQRGAFASNPALFDYLLAAHAFYAEFKPEAVLAAIPEDTGAATSVLQFSRQALRGMALEETNDPKARDHWLAMLPNTALPQQRALLELALAFHDERAHALDKVFAADSPVHSTAMRDILLSNVADAKLLRREAKDATLPTLERFTALNTLLYKEATRGVYADFVQDVDLVPADAPTNGWVDQPDGSTLYEPPVGLFAKTDNLGEYDCPALKATAARLAKNPRDPKGQLCIADFMRANGFDGSDLDFQPQETELGGTPSLFPGEPYSRLEVYRALIASAKTPAADKAYALYRAVNCYAPSGTNSCGGGDEVPIAQRKAWFLQLKKTYPNSRWAKALQYFW